MRVVTLRKHTNAYGDAFLKDVGAVYDHPSPEAEIAAGIVAYDEGEGGGAAPVGAVADGAKGGDGKVKRKARFKKGG